MPEFHLYGDPILLFITELVKKNCSVHDEGKICLSCSLAAGCKVAAEPEALSASPQASTSSQDLGAGNPGGNVAEPSAQASVSCPDLGDPETLKSILASGPLSVEDAEALEEFLNSDQGSM